MTLLQVILVTMGFVFLLMSIDLFERKRFNLLHFIVFFGGTALVVLFVFDTAILDKFGKFFGIARGADLLVYLSIISLSYLYFELLNKVSKRELEFTGLARAMAHANVQGEFEGNVETVFVLASYGEDMTAVKTIQGVLDAGFSLICVDDGKNKVSFTDQLKTEITDGRVVLITHPVNLGQGAALQSGGSYILKHIPDCKYIVHFDADGQHRIEDIGKYLEAFKKDPSLDIVLGSRFLGGSNMSKRRRFHKNLQIFFMRLFVGLKLTDTNNGYRVIARHALPKLKITLNRYAHASEIEHLIKRMKLHYTEVPIVIHYTAYSHDKGQPLSNAWGIFKKLMWKRFISK